jgi:branched-chain amino acid transport system ATP-binding protein
MHTRTKTGVLTALLLHRRSRRELGACIERAEEILASISADLFDQRHRAAGELPQADRRRLEIARALASEPDLLLLDEPSSGMDDRETAGLADELHRLQVRFPDRATIIVEHDMNLVAAFPERVLVLDYGRKIAEGPFAEIRQLKPVQEAYLGTAFTDA